jgi:hypothetical protein
MSRSYRHTPVVISNSPQSRRFAKNQANRIVRRRQAAGQNSLYKRLYCSWDIREYRFYDPLSRWLAIGRRQYRGFMARGMKQAAEQALKYFSEINWKKKIRSK